jgi:8-oxo-dGTP pyrophosphatase MutT (NUDIX family)
MYPTDLTVATVVEHMGRYLLVEEFAMGRVVLNQPGGHIESGESPEDAAIREVLEETGCRIECGELIGLYLWIHPQTRQQFVKIVYVGRFMGYDEERALDEGIVARRWMTGEDVAHRRHDLRTPVVLRCIHDFEAGRRQADGLIAGMLPLQHNVDAVLANAYLV